jgi:hypothetical protein
MSCAVVQEGARVCLGKLISHLYHSLQCSGNVRRGMLRTMMFVMVLRLRIVIPSRRKWPAFNVASALHLVERRRLGRSTRLRLLFKDGAIPSVTTILRTIFATSILVNELYTRLSNPLLSALHSLMMFRLRSRTPSKRISCLRLWALSDKLSTISRRTLWILLWATWCSIPKTKTTVMQTMTRIRSLHSVVRLKLMLYFFDVVK